MSEPGRGGALVCRENGYYLYCPLFPMAIGRGSRGIPMTDGAEGNEAQAGLRRELGLLYADHHGWLSGWLRSRVGCSHTAADLAQDT